MNEIPLFDACESSNIDLIEYLIVEHGEDINRDNWYGGIPCFDACETGNKDLVEYFIKQRADINKKKKKKKKIEKKKIG